MIELKNNKLIISYQIFTETQFNGDISVNLTPQNLFNIKISTGGLAKKFQQFSIDDISNIKTVKMPLEVAKINAIEFLTIYSIKDEILFAYNYNLKVLVTEIDNLVNYYSQLFRNLEIFRNEKYLDSITKLKVKNLEQLRFENLKKGFSVVFKVHDWTNKIYELIDLHTDLLKSWHFEILSQSNRAQRFTFQTNFKFPKEIKFSCEQYLIYFVKFLEDLGINTTSNLKEEAGKVLFSVTPTDDIEALDKIREALAVYLNLPTSPIVYDESFASMRLKQQVDNLQHAQRMTEIEFRLAQKVIENQDKIIQQKDSVIEQQSKILEKITDKAVMINSAENKEELEEIFDGVKVGKSKFLAEQLGLHLNPATALKAVGKKLIGKDDEITSLNLDKEVEE
jgi:hypothetical protein